MANTLEHDILVSGSWQSDMFKWMENVNLIVNELQTYVAELRTNQLTQCVTPPNFERETNFDIQNGDAFELASSGVQITIATDQAFDTGTSTAITTLAYWACAILSIDIDGTTHVDWGAEAVSEAAAKALLSVVTAAGEVVCGYVAVHAKAGQDFVAGTDALTGGTGGQVAQTTTYYNDQNVGDAATISSTLTNSTALKLTKG